MRHQELLVLVFVAQEDLIVGFIWLHILPT
jgi:hypothetical protein